LFVSCEWHFLLVLFLEWNEFVSFFLTVMCDAGEGEVTEGMVGDWRKYLQHALSDLERRIAAGVFLLLSVSFVIGCCVEWNRVTDNCESR